MPERERVIIGLESHREDNYEACKVCPYHYNGCETALCRDALALLREQQPVKAKILKQGMTINYRKFAFAGMCPVCNSLLLRHWVACPTCGKAVKWNG